MAQTDFLIGLVSAYEMEMLSGPIIDSHGSNDLIPGDGVTYGDSLGFGNCIHVNGVNPNGSAQISDAAQVGLSFGTGPFTIEGWIWLRDPETGIFPCDAYVVSKYGGGGYLINIQRGPYGDADQTQGNLKTDFEGAAGVSGNIVFGNAGRHQFVVTRLGSEQKLYVDGVLDVTAECSDGSFDNTEPFCIGTWPIGDGSKYEGPIDRIRLWNICLTDDEIEELYNSGNGIAYANFSGQVQPTPSPLPGVSADIPSVSIKQAINAARYKGSTVLDTTNEVGKERLNDISTFRDTILSVMKATSKANVHLNTSAGRKLNAIAALNPNTATAADIINAAKNT